MQLRSELAAVECHLARDATMPVLDATRFMCARGLRCVDAALGKGLLQMTMAIAQLPQPSWRLRSHRGRDDKWARWLRCDDLDAWECMYGTPDTAHTAACPASLAARGGHLASRNKTLVALVVLRNILLRGDRRSPLLEPGPAPWPPGALPAKLFAGMEPAASMVGAVNVSVAVRGGDACDVVEMGRLSPNLFQGVWDPRLRTRWSQQKRHCAHPVVYLEALRLLLRRLARLHRPVGSIELATDSAEAARMFAREAAALGAPVHQRPWNRSKLAVAAHELHGRGGGHLTLADRKRRWIEFRDDLDASVVVSALDDLRVLARGSVFVGSMCSSFHTMAWNGAVALQGEVVPYESVDSCAPHLDVWPSLAGTTNDQREPRGLPTFTAETLRGGPLWNVGSGRSSRFPYYAGPPPQRRSRSPATIPDTS